MREDALRYAGEHGVLYSAKGVHVVPAAAVVQHKGRNLYDLVTYDAFVLYRDFAICWFGDPRIQATDRLTLASLRETLDANAAVRFVGRARDPDEIDWSEPPADWPD